MKKVLFAFIFLFANCATLMPSASADEMFRIDVGRDDNYSDRELRRRVHWLEKAVRQLQERISSMDQSLATCSTRRSSLQYTCYIQTFGKTYIAHSSDSEMAAKAQVIYNCSQANGAMFCKDENVDCGH